MRPPRFQSLSKTLFFSSLPLLFLTTPLVAEQRFEFANEPVGKWETMGDSSLFNTSHPSVSLEIQEVSEGPKGGPARVLELKGDRRGFRNIKDFSPALKEGVIQFDLRIKSGGLVVSAFESSQSRDTIARALQLSFHPTGRIESPLRDGQERDSIRHMAFKRGVWYRAELHIKIAEGGGGTYSVKVTDLSNGEELALSNASDLPIDPRILSIAGWDFHLSRANSDVDLDNLIFLPSTSDVAP